MSQVNNSVTFSGQSMGSKGFYNQMVEALDIIIDSCSKESSGKWRRLKMSKICHILHQWFNGIEKHSYQQMYNAMKKHSLSQWLNEQKITKNGIYILFEKGELAHSTDRIVRIGTHTGEDELWSRLKKHLIGKKDISIFRKNIGRALLNKDKDPFIEQWNKKKLTKDLNHDNLIKLGEIKKRIKEIEERVTEYIRENISFVTFQVNDKKKRLELESKIISTVSLCDECKPSPNWLGLFSPIEKIRKSGLWLVNELWKTPLSENDLKELKKDHKGFGMHHKETGFERKINSLTRSDFKPLLDLIPEIQATSWFGKLKGGNKNKDGSIDMPYYEENEVVDLFRSIAYDIHIIIPFDWVKWEKGREIINNPYFDCQTIDITTICRIITAIVRNDRFCEGALISAFESGLILKLLLSIKNQLN